MLGVFIIGLFIGVGTASIGALIYLYYGLRRDELIQEITIERNKYKEFYDKYRAEKDSGY